MQYLLQNFFAEYFNLDRVEIINGDVSVPRRAQIVKDFQSNMCDGKFNLLILGPKSAGVGLTLTAATHVIHLSRWWNPAVEEQCNDRIYRIGQNNDVTIHLPIAVHPEFKQRSFDCILNNIMHRKRELFRGVLMPPVKSNEEESSRLLEELNPESDKNNQLLKEIDSQDPIQFEQWVGDIARNNGPWRTSSTSKTGDGGADKILAHKERNDEYVIVQAKHTGTPDQNLQKSAVEEVLQAKGRYLKLKNVHLV